MHNGAVIREAERNILSSIIQFASYPEVLCVIDKLTATDFTDDGCRDVFNAAVSLRQKNVDIDMVSLGAELGDSFYPILTDLSCIAITSASINHHVRILQEERQRDRIRKKFAEVCEAEDILSELNKIIEEEKGRVSTNNYADDCNKALVEAVVNICTPLDTESRIGTGFLRLDRALGKFERKTVSIIGAYPSGGKTAMAINIINYNLKHTKHKCVFFSLEMSIQQIYERMVADRCGINYSNIRDRNLNGDEKGKVGLLCNSLSRSKRLIIIDTIYYVEEICKAISDLKPDFVVIDFIHCVRTVKKCESRRSEIDYISQCFKQCAKRNNCHIILLCQLSRPEKGTKRGPRMSDLKESGGLEQDGDYIIMLHRPYVLDKQCDPCEAHILLDKNKYGDTGQIEFSFMGHYQRFVEQIKNKDGRC